MTKSSGPKSPKSFRETIGLQKDIFPVLLIVYKMTMDPLSRRAHDGSITVTYGCPSANNEAQIMFWLKIEICARTPSNWNVMLIVSAETIILEQMIQCNLSPSRCPPWFALVGPPGAHRQSWCACTFWTVFGKKHLGFGEKPALFVGVQFYPPLRHRYLPLLTN